MQNDDDQSDSGADQFKAAHAYGRLKGLLIAQKIPPHTKLDANALSRHMNISKTPVREALIHLAFEEIILNVPGSGFFSKPLNVDEISEDYDLALTILKRIIAHDLGSALNAHFVLPTKLRHLVNSSELTPAVSFEFKESIEQLYERIARSAANRKFLSVVQIFNSRTSFVRHLDLQRSDRLVQIAEDMAEFIDLLEKRDIQRAIANLDRQFHRKIDILQELVRDANLQSRSVGVSWMKLLN